MTRHHVSAARGVALLAAYLAVFVAVRAAAAMASPAATPPLVLAASAVIHGDEAGSALNFATRGKGFFDFDGDGRRDFLVTYYTRALSPDTRQEHFDIILGRETWPAESSISRLDRRVALTFPDPALHKTGDPVYKLISNADVDGDRRDDMVVRKDNVTVVQDPRHPEKTVTRVSATEIRFILGSAAPPASIDVTIPTVLRVRQPRAPRTAGEKRTVIMPDRTSSGDVNGDGRVDLVIGACDVEGPGHRDNSAGALLLYLAPWADNDGLLDLGKRQPDAAIYSSDTIDACSAQLNDVNGDGTQDFVFTGTDMRGGQPYHFGAVALGRPAWPARNEVADLATTRLVNNTAGGDVDVRLLDVDGDRKRDLVGDAFVYRAPRWDEVKTCVWLAGALTYPSELNTDACDIAFTGAPLKEASDINGDGSPDFFFGMDHHGSDPFVWRVGLGPLGRGETMEVTDSPDSGDYVMAFPFTRDRLAWRLGNVGGAAVTDMLIVDPDARQILAGDGRIQIAFGPLVAPAMRPTETPPPPTETRVPPTATQPPPTNTPLPPTDTPPSTPTRESGRTIFLPVTARTSEIR